MINEINSMINVDKIIRFENVKEENSIVISGNDSNEMVKSLKKYMNLILGKSKLRINLYKYFTSLTSFINFR